MHGCVCSVARAVGCATLSALGPVLVKLTALLAGECGRLRGVRGQILSLRRELAIMNAAVEEYAMLEDPDVQAKEWISLVMELASDIEVCIDRFTRRLDGVRHRHGNFKEVVRQVRTLGARRGIANQIDKLNARMEQVKELKDSYRLDGIACGTICHAAVDLRVRVDDSGSRRRRATDRAGAARRSRCVRTGDGRGQTRGEVEPATTRGGAARRSRRVSDVDGGGETRGEEETVTARGRAPRRSQRVSDFDGGGEPHGDVETIAAISGAARRSQRIRAVDSGCKNRGEVDPATTRSGGNRKGERRCQQSSRQGGAGTGTNTRATTEA